MPDLTSRRAVLTAATCALACAVLPAVAAAAPSSAKVDGGNQVDGLSCPSTSQCTLVDYRGPGGGGAAVTFNPLYPGTPSATLLDASGLTSISCPATTQCTAIGVGSVYTFDPAAPGSPARYSPTVGMVDVDCPSQSQCTAIETASENEPGRAVTFDPTAPGSPPLFPIDDGGRVRQLACPSSTQCTVVDGAGKVATFNPVAPGPPAPVKISDLPGFSIDCPTTSQCTAMFTNPYGGPSYALTFDPGSPAATTSTTLPVASLDVNCPSSTQCTSGGVRQATTFNPTAGGTPTPLSLIDGTASSISGIRYIDCPTRSQCTGVDYGGNEVTFDPDPPKPPPATPRRLSVSARKSVRVVGVVKNAKAGTKVAARLTGSGKLRKRATLKIGDDQSFSWKIGRLKPGTYVARFVVAGKVVKTTNIKVRT
jgi:hypothetical protein